MHYEKYKINPAKVLAFSSIVYAVLLISCNNNFDLGQGYEITTTSMNCRAIGKPINYAAMRIPVNGHVFRWNYDEHFIVAIQMPQDSLMQYVITNNFYWHEMDSLAEITNIRQFYLIDKTKDKTYGPMDSTQYSRVRAQLHVHDTLQPRHF